MRIVQLITSFIAVLAVVRPWCYAQQYNQNNSFTAHRSSSSNLKSYLYMSTGLKSINDVQSFIRERTKESGSADCCPSVTEMIEPKGGKNKDGMHLELYSNGDIAQRFYEVSCDKDVENRPCQYIDRKLYNQSKCVQKHMYTYALVKVKPGEVQPERQHLPKIPGDHSFSLDYIKVRSGCACELHPKPEKKSRPEKKRDSYVRRRHRNHHPPHPSIE